MKLLFAPTSPFVRKVMVCAHLTGQAAEIELLDSAAHPVRRDARIGIHNPLAKVPTMVLDSGQALYDSRVICEYLACRAQDVGLFPLHGEKRWQAQTRHALGDGMLDAALLARYERTARPAEMQWPVWREAQLQKVWLGLEALEAMAEDLAVAHPTIGEVTLGCVLGYLDFRFPELDWRKSFPRTHRWNEAFQALPAMQATRPYEV